MTIDRQAIEDKAKQLEDALVQTQESVKNGAMLTAIGVGAVIAVAYFMGRRGGKRKGRARVEIHRL